MSPYQVLEYHMESLETFGCIWSSKEVFKVIIGRAAHGSDQSRATPSSRSDLPIGATLPEGQGGVARVFITRRRENESGATSSERHHQVALISLSERPYQSDREESLAFSSPGDARTSPEQPLAATQQGRSRSMERLVGATSRGRCARGGRSSWFLRKTTKKTFGKSSLESIDQIVSKLKVDSLIDRLPSLVRNLITRGLIPISMTKRRSRSGRVQVYVCKSDVVVTETGQGTDVGVLINNSTGTEEKPNDSSGTEESPREQRNVSKDAETKLSESMDIPESDNGRAPSGDTYLVNRVSGRMSSS
ncbi:hypothetical protein YC2023_040585 [Brassica napus]